MAKRIDPLKAKAKRDKIVAGVLGGVLLVVSIFAVPMSLKQWKKLNGGGQTATPAATATTTPTPAPAPAAPVPGASGASTGIASTVASPVDVGDLHAFDLFESKDPFKQQVDVNAPPGSTGTGSPAPPGSPPPPAAGFTAPPAGAGTPPPAPAPTQAVISVNGATPELLAIGADFPLPPAEALFHLVSVAPGKAKISIVGGTYADGAPTVTLRRGKTLTLENTADGTRYELKLLWVGAGAPPPGLVPSAPPPSAPTQTTAAPTTP
jgi:hypothetical protein